VKGCWFGSSNIREDVPQLIEFSEVGPAQARGARVPEIGVDGVNDASRRCSRVEVARSIILHQH